jgi:glycosyltransferase involved in cell wall biosynthesis
MGISKSEINRRLVLYAPYFDSNWYLSCYPDVMDYPDGPLAHFITFGEKEFRDPNKIFNTFWFVNENREKLARGLAPFEYFLTHFESREFNPNPFVSIKFIEESYGFDLNLDNLEHTLFEKSTDFTSKWFSKLDYSKHKSIQSENSDLFRLAWQDLIGGSLILPENFHLFSSLNGDLFGKGTVIDAIKTDREPQYVCQLSPSEEITLQLQKLTLIEGNVAVQGGKPISSIRVFDAVDLKTRDNINLSEVDNYIKNNYDDIFLISNLDRGGASTYLMEIISCLKDLSSNRILVVITDIWKADLQNHLIHFSNYRTERIEFMCLRDFVNNSGRTQQILMQLIMLMKPKRLWVMNSRLGYDLISKFGRNIKSLGMDCYCFFFSEAERYLSHSREWLGKVLPYSSIISDNYNYFLSVKNRVGDFSHDFSVIRRPISINKRQILTVSRKIENRKISKLPLKVLWFGRWESKKDVWLLMEICGKYRDVTFEQYGTLEEEAPSQKPFNLKINGGVRNFDEIPVEQFDFLFFTSEFEGMPNTVLEAIAVGLPVISARVGGLTEVFSESSIFYFENSPNASKRLENAQEILNLAFTADLKTLNTLSLNAIKDLENFHSRAVIEANLRSLLEDN